MVDWTAWHDRYSNPNSTMSRRLAMVQRLIDRHLDRTSPRPVRVLSVCAGDGRDILGVLADRDDADRVIVTLLEQDPELCARARARAVEAHLDSVEVREVDASSSESYVGAVPTDLILLVGTLGHLSDADAKRLIDSIPAMCNPRALLIWSRRREGEIVATIRGWLAERDFDEVFESPRAKFHLGGHRFSGAPREFQQGRKLFAFTPRLHINGYGSGETPGDPKPRPPEGTG